jgi:ribosomal protein S16
MTDSNKKIKQTIKARLLQSHLIDRYGLADIPSLAKQMASEYQLNTQMVERWLKNGAVISNEKVFLMKSKFEETEQQKAERIKALRAGVELPLLEEHIEQAHNGNNSAFARAYKSTQQQISRWVNEKMAYWGDGQVFRMQMDLTASN